jgi:para-nitrobenzyl esterase
VIGDALFVCPARRAARAITAAGAPVYRYTFQKALENPLLQTAGVVHSAEIPFVFGNDDYPLGAVGSSGAPLAAAMQRYWTRFGAAHDPNGSGDPTWPLWGSASDPYQVLDAPISSGSGLETDACDFWDPITLAL